MERNELKPLNNFVFLAMSEDGLPASSNGLTTEVIFQGKDLAEAERTARIVLGQRYRGTSTVPARMAIVVQVDSELAAYSG